MVASMDGVDSVQTARLTGRPLKEVDFSDLRLLHSNPEVMATLGGVRTPEETQCFLKACCEHWQQHGFGLWAFREKHSMDFVGRGGLRKATLEHGNEIELTYA
ncbi:MAG TPA: GNAT family N-acetyltransferase, partial [Opitutae bacterium]|nr:GNAT family N-acetyltransferase [Opitutae bacterium]